MICNQEMCPFWTGEGCICSVLDIEEEERDVQTDWIDGEW